jgi:endonuclease-3 related protein
MRPRLELIYKKLYSAFGRQHWWPAESPFEVVVGAILTQNTNWLNVEKALGNLKKRRLLKPHRLLSLPEEKLASFLVPAGYYNIKARRLKNFLKFLSECYRGKVSNMALKDTAALRQELLSVNGIGQETADSILLYALEKPVFVVDAYTKRIFSRHALIREGATYEETQNLFMKNLKRQTKLFNEYHALLVKLGKEFCLKKKPRCSVCPLGKISFLIFLFCLGLISPLRAAPCYGTRMPSKGKFFAGFQTYSIFKRYLEASQGRVKSVQHFFLLSYAVFDWFSIDLKGGAGNIEQHPEYSQELRYTSNFAGGYGFRLKLYDREKVKMVFGFQHISVHPKGAEAGEAKHHAVLDDWQYSFLISRAFLKATPYLGMRWSRLDYIHWMPDKRKRVMSDLTKSLGLIVGFDLPLAQGFWLNVEGQFLDSRALALSANFSF